MNIKQQCLTLRIEIETATAALEWLSNTPAAWVLIVSDSVYAAEGTEWVVVA